MAAVFIGGIVRAMKAGFWPEWLYVPAKHRIYVVLALGWLSGSLESLIMGKPLLEALIGGFISSATAVLGHQTFIESMRGGKELMAK